jgi:phage terminase large subunit GpA-like protein
VDSQYLASQVYLFCSLRRARRVYAVRGINVAGLPIIGRPSRNNQYRTPVYGICTDTAKLQIFARLQIPVPPAGEPAPGCMHFPAASWMDAEYFAQLTAEKGIRKYVKGKGSVRIWQKTRERNEALDLEVYCLAALHIRGAAVIANLANRAARLSERPGGAVTAPATPAAPSRGIPARSVLPSRQRGWVKGWRR